MFPVEPTAGFDPACMGTAWFGPACTIVRPAERILCASGNLLTTAGSACYELYIQRYTSKPVLVKEKTFVDDSKSKSVSWFSNRHRQFMPAVHAGFQFATGLNIKFKYYLNSFFNPDHSDYAANYERFDANVFYVSLNSNLFKGSKFTYSPSE